MLRHFFAVVRLAAPTAEPRIVNSRVVTPSAMAIDEPDVTAARTLEMQWENAAGERVGAQMTVLRKQGRLVVVGSVFWSDPTKV